VKLGVRLGGSADPSQQVLKVKIDSTSRKREATLESAVWRATLRLSLRAGFLKEREKGCTPSCFLPTFKDNPRYTFHVDVAHPPLTAEVRLGLVL
jgi:hypothetical protein